MTSLERLNPDRRTAFLLAFLMDLKIPKPQSPVSFNNSEEITEDKGRISLTEKERDRVLKSKGVPDSLLGGLKILWSGIGTAIDLLSGGLTLGIPTAIGAIVDVIRSLWDD